VFFSEDKHFLQIDPFKNFMIIEPQRADFSSLDDLIKDNVAV
jgi:hypothetical protein